MNEFLTQHFLSMKRDKNYQTLFASTTKDNVISFLDQNFPNQWAMETLHVFNHVNDVKFSVAVYLPGLVMCGNGKDESEAICNAVTKLSSAVSNIRPTTIQEAAHTEIPTENNKLTTESVMQQLESMQASIQNKQQEQEPQYLEFGSPEQQAFDNQFFDEAKKSEDDPLKQPTKEEVNPTGEILVNKWVTEQGEKLKQWSINHQIASKEQMSAWFIKYCGLDYDHFNPEWVDKFIAWTEALREKQTY